MRFLLDENIPGHTEAFLHRSGHEVIRPPTRATDAVIAGLAKRRRAVLLTRDQDFLGFLPSQHSGIVVIRIHPSVAETITNAVGVLLAAHSQRWLRGKVLVLLPDGYEVIR